MADTPAEAMAVAASATFGFYAQAHLSHWNVVGADFPQLHGFFGGLYEEAWEAVDRLAEALRTLDEPVPATVFSTPGEVPADAAAMVAALSDANDAVLQVLEDAYRACAEEPALQNVLQDRLEAHEKHGWMLRATEG